MPAGERDTNVAAGHTSTFDLHEQIRKLEEDYAAKDVKLSGRIVHVAHYLPIVATWNNAEYIGVPTPPRTPDRRPASLASSSSVRESVQGMLPISLQPPSPTPAQTAAESKWSFSLRRGHTAMHSGIRSLSYTHEQVMIGWTGPIHVAPTSSAASNSYQTNESSSLASIVPTSSISDEDKALLDEQVKHWEDETSPDPKPKPMTYGSVWLDDSTAHDHYDGYCKKTLWPLFHYLLWQDVTTELPVEDTDWKAYVRANEAYAKRVAELYKPGDLIWIHDYHCLLVPRLVRQLIPDAYIGLFIHTPFPSSEVFRCLPSTLLSPSRTPYHYRASGACRSLPDP